MIKKLGYSIPVNIKDGKPQCPGCHEPMVETEPEIWECPLSAPIVEALTEELAKALDNLIERG